MSNGSFSNQPEHSEIPDFSSRITLDGHFAETIFSSLFYGFHSTSILVCAEDGTVLYANNVALHGFPTNMGQTAVGKNLCDLAPKDWALERIEYIKLAIQRNRPLILIEILCGNRLSCTFSPIKLSNDDNSRSAAFIAVEPVTPPKLKRLRAVTNPDDLFDAKVIDLGKLARLTPREIEVLALMGDGLRQKQIAEKLHRSVSTIDRHRERIGEKLGVTDRIELVALAREAALEVSDAKRTNSSFGHKRFEIV